MSELPSPDAQSLFHQLRKYRVVWLVVSMLAVDCVVVGPAIGSGRTLSRAMDLPWLWVGPFTWRSRQTDVLILALASSQIGLLAIWSFFSLRPRVIRASFWVGLTLLWSTALLLLHNAPFTLFDLTWCFVFESLGAIIGLGFIRLAGYRLQTIHGEAEGTESPPHRQYSLADLMLFSALIGAVCLFVSWLDYFWGFESFIWKWYSVDSADQVKLAARFAILGAVGSLAVWACLGEKLVAVRASCVVLAAGFLGWLLIGASVHYEQYVELTIGPREVKVAGWPAWFAAQGLIQVVALLAVRSFGYRFVQPPRAEQESKARQRLLSSLTRRIATGMAAILLVIAVIYGAVVIFPEYRANRELLNQTHHIGAVFRLPHLNQVHMNVSHALDDATVEALSRHRVVTHLKIYNLSQDDGTLAQLRKLPFLQGIHFSNPTISNEALQQLSLELPNTSIGVWNQQIPK